MKKTTYQMALRGMLIAIAFALSWIEMQIPYFFPIPGIKLGLSNLVVLLALYRLGIPDAFAINMLRILLVGLTFGNAYALAYSFAGGILSFLVMTLLKQWTKLSIRFVSVAGGIMHNVGQILVAMFVLQSLGLLWYLPYLWISGIVAGILIGLLCEIIIRRIPAPLQEVK